MWHPDQPINALIVNNLGTPTFAANNLPYVIYVPNLTLPLPTRADHVPAKANSATTILSNVSTAREITGPMIQNAQQ
jgi:hypothetical protein